MKITKHNGRINLDITMYELWILYICLDCSYGYGGIDEGDQLQILRLKALVKGHLETIHK